MEPIDFVLIWVDGGDPQWQQEKNRRLAELTGVPATVDAGENRYRDWDNLRYWFRGVEKFAPWVRQVHFVTCGQRPSWLNPLAPRLHLVDHRDYIPQAYLPTFSANPIELNLHRIAGLAEQFVYFNDDFFLTAPVVPEDFFVKGLPCDYLGEQPVEFTKNDVFYQLLVNDLVAVNRHFTRAAVRRAHPGLWYSPASGHDLMKNLLLTGLRNRYFFGIRYDHLPQPFRKDTFRRVWEAEPELLDQTCRHPFRDSRDVNQYLPKYWQLLEGRFHPYNRRRAGKVFSGDYDPREAAACIRSGSRKMVCVNDTVDADFEQAKQLIRSALEQLLPEKSSFEM